MAESLAWQIELEPESSSGMPATQAIMLELDPRHPRLFIGARNLTGGSQEIWQRAVIRVPLLDPPADRATLHDWLHSDGVSQLLSRVSQGYRAEILWSGDFIGHWSEDALQAVDALVAGLGGAVQVDR
jgi:hypothetical protein